MKIKEEKKQATANTKKMAKNEEQIKCRKQPTEWAESSSSSSLLYSLKEYYDTATNITEAIASFFFAGAFGLLVGIFGEIWGSFCWTFDDYWLQIV